MWNRFSNLLPVGRMKQLNEWSPVNSPYTSAQRLSCLNTIVLIVLNVIFAFYCRVIFISWQVAPLGLDILDFFSWTILVLCWGGRVDCIASCMFNGWLNEEDFNCLFNYLITNSLFLLPQQSLKGPTLRFSFVGWKVVLDRISVSEFTVWGVKT